MKRRIVSVLLVLSMLLAMLPAAAFADSLEDDSPKVENRFSDVSESDWFYDGVMHAMNGGLFAGVSADSFDPHGTMTRAMYVTVLGRMAEIDTAPYEGRSDFHDVDADSWYAAYLAWAVEKGIVKGVGEGRFDPEGLITREQMAVMTVRLFDVYQIEYPPRTVDTEPADVDSISAYAKDAVTKLWQCGLFEGDSAGNFNPERNASRAEAAAFSTRVDADVEQRLVESGKKEPPKQETGSIQQPKRVYYRLTFDSNGGSEVETLSRRRGSTLSNLPAPYKANSIFHGWCYDQSLERLVSGSDTLQGNMVLYAKWGETTPLPEDETPAFARAIDTTADFTIEIAAPDGWSAEQVREAITVKNISSNEDKEWISIVPQGDVFEVSGVNYGGVEGARQEGFVAGANYKLTLDDDALSFVGQDTATREYDFTIQKPDVMNVSLSDDLRYISTGALTDLVVNGKSATEISVAVITIGQDGSTTQNGAQTTGSFTYTDAALEVGDSVGIYEGDVIPDMNSSAAGDEMSFVTITAAEGSSYSYQGAAVDEVLFMPDVLPVSKTADADGNARDSSMTVPVEDMTYTDDKYAALGLTSQTTVDEGDFIAFYSGKMRDSGAGATAAGYARIDAVAEVDGDYIIGYTAVTQEEMMEAMAAYRKEQLEGEELLEDVDRAEIERSVERQARSSGFANEAGMYLAAMALETDSFTEISEDFDLSEYSVTMPQGMNRSGLVQMRGSKVEVDVTTLQATLSTRLIHFENLSGLRLTLTVGVEVTIHAPAGDIKIEISGSFEQEVKIDLGVDGNAVWKWWFIFPYIAEYQVTAWVDLYTFTGIGIEATITTAEADDGEGMGTGDETFEDIGQQIKDLLDEKDKYLGDGEDTVVSTLEEKYAEMLENESDWVDLFEKTIFEQHFRIILIIDIEIKVSFVVSANMNISLGLDFWYENAKRYMYTVEVFSGNVRNDTIDLVTEHYEFEFYVMGTMGLRAGVRASIAVGLFSTKLASVGFAAEAGVYVRVWGYFYYQLVFDANARPQKTTYYAGALLFELGIYLEITFEAQAFNGTFSYNPTLLDKEWPLWSAGMRESIRSFAYGAEDAPELKMKKAIQTTIAPDSLFEMSYLDLKTGDNESKAFDDSPKYFTIEMTNNKFAYDRATNRLTVSPEGEDFNLDGEMVLTWVNQPLAFSSVAIQRRIPLHWDKLNDGYAIVFHTGGGSSIPLIIARYGAPITPPQDPVKKGYVFAGWHSDEALTQPYTIPETMPNVDMELYAKWTPAEDTSYRVEHYGEVLGRTQYDLLDTEHLQGVTDSEVSAQPKTYLGYTTPAVKKITILPDGSAALRYYYDLAAFTLTFDAGIAKGEPSVTTLKYGAVITPPVFRSKGYTFTGWDSNVVSHMPAADLTYVAQWEAGADTPYRVEYYVQQTDGRFTLQHLEEKTGVTGGIVEVSALLDPSYLVDDGISYQDVTVGGQSTTAPVITEDGKLIIKINYARERHTVTYGFENESPDRVDSYPYEGHIVRPEDPIRTGYTFAGWDAEIPPSMGTTDLEFTAQWTANADTPYKVEHYLQNANDEDYTLKATDHLTGTTDTEAEAVAHEYPFFALNEGARGNIAPDGSLVLELYYNRETFTVSYEVDGEPYDEPQTYKHGQTVVYPDEPEKEGYNFGYWELDAAFGGVMPAEDITLSAYWLPMSEYAYTVNYYQQGLNGADNILLRSERPTGVFDTEVTVEPMDEYEGFTPPTKQTVTISKGLVVDLVYTRNTYKLSWAYNGGTVNADVYFIAGDVQFDSPILRPELIKTGYTYRWEPEPVSHMGTQNLFYEAQWTPNPYIVKFNPNGGSGTMADMPFTYDAAQSLASNAYTRTGYTFVGWARTPGAAESAFANGESVQNLTVAVNGAVTLYAVWKLITYDIAYELYGGENANGNQTSYTVTENVSLGDATRTGYTFGGWYLDAELTQKADTIAIPAGSTGAKTFYAKWTANTYTVTFDKNVGDGNTDVQLLTYDKQEVLKTQPFTRDGYDFTGWNTKADGSGTKYTDMQAVKNLAESGMITLYAQWTPISYAIAYLLGDGVNDSANPASYTVESEDIRLASPTRDGGYGFMGWFDGDTEVKEIIKGTTGNKVLTAKWGFAGRFTVTNNGNNTFTITREGDGNDGAQNVGQQTVYFRTVNGTAIGGTHFVHQGGNYAAAAFKEDGTSKTVTIEEYGVAKEYNPDGINSYVSTAYSNSDRTYELELVRVEGGGVLGSEKKATRTMTKDASKVIDARFYVSHTFDGGGAELRIDKETVIGGSEWWDTGKRHRFPFESYHFGGSSLKSSIGYFTATVSSGDAVSAEVVANIRDIYPCEEHMRITELDSFNSSKASRKFDAPNKVWATYGLGPVQYALSSNGISIYYGLWGHGANVFVAVGDKYTLRVNDTREPRLIGPAPMATGSYEAGETVTISMVFDEIVANPNGVTITGTNLTGEWKCTGGTGSNVLTFTGTLAKNCTDENLTDGVKLNGTVLDMVG